MFARPVSNCVPTILSMLKKRLIAFAIYGWGLLIRQAHTLSHRPHLDAPDARARNPRGYLNSIVEVPGLDEKIAAKLFLGLGEGTVDGRSG